MDGFDPGRDCGGEMAGGACDSCASWREHYYWNHMSDDKKQFLVVASDDFRNSMRIPNEVESHLRNMIPDSDSFKLEAPNGHIYPVEVGREVGEIVLRSRWSEFVNAHHIENNDSILFMYRGNSGFKVRLFTSSGHEKFLPCSQPPSGISGDVPPFPPCGHHVPNEQVVPNPGHLTTTDFDYTMLPGYHLLKAQDDEVLKIARAKRSETPLYVSAMSKRNVSLKNCYVYIPLRLVDNFKEEKATVQLEAPDKKTYSVEASKHSDYLIIIESGWNVFVSSLRIQENDLLIFIRKGKARLEVLILDPSGHEKTSSCSVMGNRSSSDQEMRDDSVQTVDPPPHQFIDLSSSDDDDDIVRKGTRESCMAQKRGTRSCAKSRKMASTSSPSTKSGFVARKTRDRAPVKLGVGSVPASNNLGRPSQRSYILGRRGALPLKLKRKVEEKVQKIRSALPIFVKVMGSNNVDGIGCITCEMIFCKDYAKACLPEKGQTLFLQLEGKKTLWETRLFVRPYKSRIIKGWKEFSTQNSLKVGDTCLFKLEDTNTSSLKMTVYLLRKSQI